MRRIIYGTRNAAKVESMRNRLRKLDMEIESLQEAEERLHIVVPDVKEDGKNPLENARQKAQTYFKALREPVFSCDSGLFIDGVSEEEQPGVLVRRVRGKVLTDEEMVEYYTDLARRYHNPRAQYRNAICMIDRHGKLHERMDEGLGGESFILAAVARPIQKAGFPLDSLSIDIKTGKYYYDLREERLDKIAVEDGFIRFFQQNLEYLQE